MLAATQKILDLWYNDEFKIFIIQGDHGYGKTTYANRIIAEVYSNPEFGWGGNGKTSNWNRELFKHHLGFHPAYVLDIWMKKRKRDLVYHWDDTGLWLHSLDWQDPFVKEIGKYMQTARTDWACIIFSCIDRADITSKIRGLRHAITIDITKEGSNKRQPDRRTATAVTYWKNRRGKTGYNFEWEEMFDSHVPGDPDDPSTFYGWYNPLRVQYSDMAKRLAKEKLERKKDIMKLRPKLHI